MSDTVLRKGGAFPASSDLVSHDGTLAGDGTTYNPLTVVGGVLPPTIQTFQYVVTGLEPDLTEIAVTLPTPMPDSFYAVIATCQGCDRIAAFDVYPSSRTSIGFVLTSSGALSAGDVVAFVASAISVP